MLTDPRQRNGSEPGQQGKPEEGQKVVISDELQLVWVPYVEKMFNTDHVHVFEHNGC